MDAVKCLVKGCDQPRVTNNGLLCAEHERSVDRRAAERAPVEVAEYVEWPRPTGLPTNDAESAGPGQIVCSHCQVKGNVTTRRVKQKKGLSGGKATGALITGGLSLFATGLSRKETVTEMRCGNCTTTWYV